MFKLKPRVIQQSQTVPGRDKPPLLGSPQVRPQYREQRECLEGRQLQEGKGRSYLLQVPTANVPTKRVERARSATQNKKIRSREGVPSYKRAPFISTDALSLKLYFFPTVLLLRQISQLVFFQNTFFYFFILNLSMPFFFRHDADKQNTAAFQFNPIARYFHRLFVLVLTNILGIVFYITLCF